MYPRFYFHEFVTELVDNAFGVHVVDEHHFVHLGGGGEREAESKGRRQGRRGGIALSLVRQTGKGQRYLWIRGSLPRPG